MTYRHPLSLLISARALGRPGGPSSLHHRQAPGVLLRANLVASRYLRDEPDASLYIYISGKIQSSAILRVYSSGLLESGLSATDMDALPRPHYSCGLWRSGEGEGCAHSKSARLYIYIYIYNDLRCRQERIRNQSLRTYNLYPRFLPIFTSPCGSLALHSPRSDRSGYHVVVCT